MVFQWRSSVNLHNWNTLEDHWKATGSTLALIQWHSSVHWGLYSRHTGLPLEDHWLRVRVIKGLILGLRPGNERRRYFVTTSLNGVHKPRFSPESFQSSICACDGTAISYMRYIEWANKVVIIWWIGRNLGKNNQCFIPDYWPIHTTLFCNTTTENECSVHTTSVMNPSQLARSLHWLENSSGFRISQKRTTVL